MEFKGSKGKWYADIRSGCCAVYPESKKDDSNGISCYDDRNIYYSNKGAVYDEGYGYWTMDEESQANALLISKSPEMLEMLKEIFKLINNNYDSEPELMKELGFDDKLFVKIEQLINSATNF